MQLMVAHSKTNNEITKLAQFTPGETLAQATCFFSSISAPEHPFSFSPFSLCLDLGMKSVAFLFVCDFFLPSIFKARCYHLCFPQRWILASRRKILERGEVKRLAWRSASFLLAMPPAGRLRSRLCRRLRCHVAAAAARPRSSIRRGRRP
jgi:hypothetical protein